MNVLNRELDDERLLHIDLAAAVHLAGELAFLVLEPTKTRLELAEVLLTRRGNFGRRSLGQLVVLALLDLALLALARLLGLDLLLGGSATGELLQPGLVDRLLGPLDEVLDLGREPVAHERLDLRIVVGPAENLERVLVGA